MNPYDPPELSEHDPNANASPRRRLWPLLMLNVAFVLCAILVVALPGLGTWLVVSVLVTASIGGWALAKNLYER